MKKFWFRFNTVYRSLSHSFTPQQIFDVVANVDEYREFLPYCIESKVIHRSPNRIKAELAVGINALLVERYTSVVHLQEPNQIRVQTIENDILKHLESLWKFDEIDLPSRSPQTLVSFNVEYEFKSVLHTNMMNLFVEDFIRNTMKAFLSRAKTVYSNKNNRARQLNSNDDGRNL